MPDEDEDFAQTLLRLLQSGYYEEWLGCEHGRCATLEWRLQRSYRVHVGRRQIVLSERDAESVRRQDDGRWKGIAPMVRRKPGRIVMDRATGTILEAPTLGTLRVRKRRRPHQTPSICGAS